MARETTSVWLEPQARLRPDQLLQAQLRTSSPADAAAGPNGRPGRAEGCSQAFREQTTSVSTTRFRRPQPGAGRGARRGSAPSTCTSGSQLSQEGRYQLRSPRIFIVAGTRTERTIVASISSDRDAEAHLLEGDRVPHREAPEDGDDDQRGAGDEASSRSDAKGDGVRVAGLLQLADATEQEHLVVHREPEEDGEQKQRNSRRRSSRPHGVRGARSRFPPGRRARAARMPLRPRAGSCRFPSRARRSSGTPA